MGLLRPNTSKHKTTNMVYPSTSGMFRYSYVGGKPISYVSASSALKNPNVYSVINRIATDVAAAHFKTENLASLKRLESPSRIINRFSFWQSVIIQLCLAGNAYVPIVNGNLEHVPPSDVQIEYLPGNKGVIYTVMENNDRPKLVLRQDQMLHFKLMPDPTYRYLIGLSPLESLQGALSISKKSDESNLNALEHQINASGKLKLTGVLNDGEDIEDARDLFEKANTGDNSGRLMVLPDGFDYTEFEIKSDVFKVLNENAAYSADQVSQVYGVPSDIMGGGTSTESQHSNVEQIKGTYLANLNTYVNPLVEECSLKFKAPDLKLDIKNMLDVDDSILIGQLNDLRKTGGISSEQVQFMLMRSGFLPYNIPEYVEPATKGGEDNAKEN